MLVTVEAESSMQPQTCDSNGTNFFQTLPLLLFYVDLCEITLQVKYISINLGILFPWLPSVTLILLLVSSH